MLNSTEDRRFNLSAKIMVYRQVQLLYLKSLGFGNANANICLFFESRAFRAGQCDDGKSERFADLCCGSAVCGIARGAYAKQHIPGVPSPISSCAYTRDGSTSLQNAELSAVSDGSGIAGTASCSFESTSSPISGLSFFVSALFSGEMGRRLKKPFISSPVICSQSAQLPAALQSLKRHTAAELRYASAAAEALKRACLSVAYGPEAFKTDVSCLTRIIVCAGVKPAVQNKPGAELRAKGQENHIIRPPCLRRTSIRQRHRR